MNTQLIPILSSCGVVLSKPKKCMCSKDIYDPERKYISSEYYYFNFPEKSIGVIGELDKNCVLIVGYGKTGYRHGDVEKMFMYKLDISNIQSINMLKMFLDKVGLEYYTVYGNFQSCKSDLEKLEYKFIYDNSPMNNVVLYYDGSIDIDKNDYINTYNLELSNVPLGIDGLKQLSIDVCQPNNVETTLEKPFGCKVLLSLDHYSLKYNSYSCSTTFYMDDIIVSNIKEIEFPPIQKIMEKIYYKKVYL